MTKRLCAGFVCLLCLAFAAAAPPEVSAQAVYGRIFGTITDQQGAAVVGAKVTITNVGKGTKMETTTNEAGNYTVTHLIPGIYDLRAEVQGFKAFEAKGIQVFADQAARVDGSLQVGAVTETVTVTAEEVPLLKTDRADVATTFTGRELVELPLFERNFTLLQLSSPGAQMLSWEHASSENPQGSKQIMVNGHHFGGTSFQLDGTDNRDPILGIIVINPTLESISETKITTAVPDAEFGQAVSAVITAQTRSGTNDYHGSAFWFRRTDWLQARNPFSQPPPAPLPITKWNQFGGSLGGPIIENKLFFFGDYQGTRRIAGASKLKNVPAFPSATARADCLAGIQCNLSLYPVAIFDPTTGNPDGTGRVPFAGNVIPAVSPTSGQQLLSPQALALLARIPAPNAGAAGAFENNFIGAGSERFNDDAFNTRIDYSFSEKLRIFGRYSFADFRKSATAIFGEEVGGEGLSPDGFAGEALTRNQSVATGFDYSFGPTWLTDFRFGWFRYRVEVFPGGLGTTPAQDAGIPGLNTIPGLAQDPIFTSGMPEFNIEGRGGFRFGYALGTNRCNCPLDQKERQYQFVNNWTNIRGNHNIKFGADIRHARNLRVASDKHRAGQLSFNEARTGLQGPGGGGGLGIATFLLGDATFFERYASTVDDAGETQHRWFFYGQDTWRITPRLTFNYGLRWEIYRPQTVTRNEGGGFLDLSTGKIRVAGVGGIDRAMDVQTEYQALAPRLGIAYQVTDKTVLRMGYGRSFDIGVFGSVFGHSVTQNLPVFASQEERGAGGNSWLAAFDLANGPPPPFFGGPIPADGLLTLPAGIAQFVQTDPTRLPTIDAWNVTIQREITPTMSAEVGYVGNKGTHVFAGDGPDYNCNQPTVVGFASGVSRDARRPFFSRFGWTQDLRCHLNDASKNFHSLQARLNRRLSQGIQFQANYTWGKGLNYDGDYYVIDPRVNYGPNSFDRTHQFNFTSLFELPFGRGKRFATDAGDVLDHIIGGWQLSTAATFLSGLPFTPSYQSCGSDIDTGPCRPHLVGDPQVGGDRDNYFAVVPPGSLATNGATAGPWQRPQKEEFGNVGRNNLRGPGFYNVNLSIVKNTRVTERVNAQFRADIFNVFNIVSLGQPNATVDGGGDSGKIRSTAFGSLQRQVQFALRLSF